MTLSRRHLLAALPLLALLAACAGTQISATVLASYDGAVSAETAALATGKISPAEATKLRACRVAAYKGVQAVVTAEASGGSASGVAPVANGAIAAYLVEAQAAPNGGGSGC